ncbi:MAG TPA: metal-dependent transcriptional regulator [Anaerolineae bacterium]
MKVSESAQELLEHLWLRIEDNSQGEPVIDVVDSAEASELANHGFVTIEQKTLKLTAAGEPEAAMAVRRHRLAERLLVDVLSTSDAQLDIQACQLEHALFEGVDETICTLLGHPQFCPHGKPIPPGECCRQLRVRVDRLIAPLSEMNVGEQGVIAYLHMGNAIHSQKLMAMGVLPGTPISLQRRAPSFVFEVGYSQFAVDELIAADIYVRLANDTKAGTTS